MLNRGPIGAAELFSSKMFGGPVDHQVNRLTLTTDVTQIVKGDPNRVLYMIVNLGNAAVYGGFDESVSSSNGFYIGPNGGAIKFTVQEDADLVSLPFYCVSGTSGQNLFVVEIAMIGQFKEGE